MQLQTCCYATADVLRIVVGADHLKYKTYALLHGILKMLDRNDCMLFSLLLMCLLLVVKH